MPMRSKRSQLDAILCVWLLAGPLLAAAEPSEEMSTAAPESEVAAADAAALETEAAVEADGAAAADAPAAGEHAAEVDPRVRPVEHEPGGFRPDPSYPATYDPAAQQEIYGGKHMNKTARPPIELGRDLYREGPFSESGRAFGAKNPTKGHVMVYGDWRVGAAYNDNGVADENGTTYQSTVATRLNLDFDLGLTATERIHVFVRPFDQNGDFTRYDISGKNEDSFEDNFDFNVDTVFFEGDMGALAMGASSKESRFDLPFAVGFMPLLTQNGVWLEDAFVGAAFGVLSARNSRALDISNFDVTLFAGFDELTTGAATDRNGVLLEDVTDVYGLFGFVDANRGYWEFGYAYVDIDVDDLAYHNLTVAFSQRYGAFVSNSIRLIANVGQDPVEDRAKTADGELLLIESSFITKHPSTVVPYVNLFVGLDTPQPLAKDAGAGGVLKNTGLSFETDGLTGFPRLDDRGHDSWGGAIGIEHLFKLDQQLVVEGAAVSRFDDSKLLGDQYGLSVRYQRPFTNAWIVRVDVMHGWVEDHEDLFGARIELRRKL